MQEQEEELKVLSHEAWPGYRKAFLIVFAILTVYLAAILISEPGGGFISHDSHGKDAHHDEAEHHDESDAH